MVERAGYEPAPGMPPVLCLSYLSMVLSSVRDRHSRTGFEPGVPCKENMVPSPGIKPRDLQGPQRAPGALPLS